MIGLGSLYSSFNFEEENPQFFLLWEQIFLPGVKRGENDGRAQTYPNYPVMTYGRAKIKYRGHKGK